MKLLYQILILFISQFFYYSIAKKLKFFDKPNSRSSHNKLTIIGGGIIFPIGISLWIINSTYLYNYFLFGLFLISAISFIDDIFHINQIIRFIVHLVSSYLLLYQLNFNFDYFLILLLVLVLIIGWLNAYNFMDGINGMLSMYSIAIFITFYLLNLQNQFIDTNLFVIMFFSLLIFSFFNLRKNAIMFSGDIGSISLAYIIVFIFLIYINDNFNLIYMLFFSIYGIESVITILQRILNKKNIFKPHRTHLYQYLANELKISHLTISFVYSIAQLLINIFVLYIIIPNNLNNIICFASVLFILSVAYIFIKIKVVTLIQKDNVI